MIKKGNENIGRERVVVREESGKKRSVIGVNVRAAVREESARKRNGIEANVIVTAIVTETERIRTTKRSTIQRVWIGILTEKMERKRKMMELHPIGERTYKIVKDKPARGGKDGLKVVVTVEVVIAIGMIKEAGVIAANVVEMVKIEEIGIKAAIEKTEIGKIKTEADTKAEGTEIMMNEEAGTGTEIEKIGVVMIEGIETKERDAEAGIEVGAEVGNEDGGTMETMIEMEGIKINITGIEGEKEIQDTTMVG